mmetsp:Transcript_136034/g.290835  ORF Transcript_136034/g.290835 Transcript_136034/m.290835 type:complete len:291 (+) Transcript_136034:186-1058(+)
MSWTGSCATSARRQTSPAKVFSNSGSSRTCRPASIRCRRGCFRAPSEFHEAFPAASATQRRQRKRHERLAGVSSPARRRHSDSLGPPAHRHGRGRKQPALHRALGPCLLGATARRRLEAAGLRKPARLRRHQGRHRETPRGDGAPPSVSRRPHAALPPCRQAPGRCPPTRGRRRSTPPPPPASSVTCARMGRLALQSMPTTTPSAPPTSNAVQPCRDAAREGQRPLWRAWAQHLRGVPPPQAVPGVARRAHCPQRHLPGSARCQRRSAWRRWHSCGASWGSSTAGMHACR